MLRKVDEAIERQPEYLLLHRLLVGRAHIRVDLPRVANSADSPNSALVFLPLPSMLARPPSMTKRCDAARSGQKLKQ
jgi:hypothetical protein